jgi:hypothetical protein
MVAAPATCPRSEADDTGSKPVGGTHERGRALTSGGSDESCPVGANKPTKPRRRQAVSNRDARQSDDEPVRGDGLAPRALHSEAGAGGWLAARSGVPDGLDEDDGTSCR